MLLLHAYDIGGDIMYGPSVVTETVWVNFNDQFIGKHHNGPTNDAKELMISAHERVNSVKVRRLNDQQYGYSVELLIDIVKDGDKQTERVNSQAVVEEWVLHLRKEPAVIANFQVK
jgi:hypothetical protein